MLITNGKLITWEVENRILEGNALYIEGDKIAEIGPEAELKAKELDSVKERVTCLEWELGYVPPLRKIIEAVQKGFEEGLGIRL